MPTRSNLSKIAIGATGVVLGLSAGLAGLASAQTPVASTGSTTMPSADARPRGHAPIGGDGNITSISGTNIVMTEEADEGGAAFTIDASSATFMVNGAAGKISDFKVGDKIFVKGTTTGTNVKATEVSSGHPPRGAFGHGGRGHGFMNPADSATPSTSTTTQ